LRQREQVASSWSGFAQNAAVTNGFRDLIVELWARRDDTHARPQGKVPRR
jgi:hypothetical protein